MRPYPPWDATGAGKVTKPVGDVEVSTDHTVLCQEQFVFAPLLQQRLTSTYLTLCDIQDPGCNQYEPSV